MDNLQLEIQSLKKLREHYEQQLRIFGLDLCDIPDDVSTLMDECVELQRATNLHELEERYLREFYYTKHKERIDNNLTIAKMQAEIKEQEVQMAKEAAECATLEKFTTAVNKRLVSEAEMQRNKIMLETKIKALQERQKSLNIPEDLSIDELIKKIELLENTKTKDK